MYLHDDLTGIATLEPPRLTALCSDNMHARLLHAYACAALKSLADLEPLRPPEVFYSVC